MELHQILRSLSEKRRLFHSEADFQFALAWEVKSFHPACEIRLEIPVKTDQDEQKKRIDIVVRDAKKIFPIELKYLKKTLHGAFGGETYDLATGVHDMDMHDCLKDIARLEALRERLAGFCAGYAVWLTNDNAYWNADYNASYYKEFHAPDGTEKSGMLRFSGDTYITGQKGYKSPVVLQEKYRILWRDYSDLDIKNGVFKYAVITVEK